MHKTHLTRQLVVPVTPIKSHYWEQWENKRCFGSDSLSVSFLQVILWLPQMQSVVTIICLGVWKGSGTKKFTVHPKRWRTGPVAGHVQEGTAWGEETPHYFRLGPAPQGSTHCWLQGSELATGQWCHTCPADLPTSLRRWSPDLSPKGTWVTPTDQQDTDGEMMGKTKDRQTWIPLCRS